jgi:hypothetical protein
MALSSGIKVFVLDAVLWRAVAAVGFADVHLFDDVRAFTSRIVASTAPAENVALHDPMPRQTSFASDFERSVTLKASRNRHF